MLILERNRASVILLGDTSLTNELVVLYPASGRA